MKKVIIALAIVVGTGVFFSSCKSKDKCDAYRGSTTAHRHNG